MITIVTIIHILVSIGLILVVLLQTGKGADMGAVFGGSSSTIFGSSGAGNFLTRLTTGMAIVFMITSLTLGYFSGKRASSSVFDSRSGQTEQSAPASPKGATTGATPQPAPPSAAPQPQPAAPQK
jgi:preprotein translocase subunit SecG